MKRTYPSWLEGQLNSKQTEYTKPTRLLGDDGMLIITADHGCDPGYLKHTDHTREYIPMIALGKSVRPVNLGTRVGFCDIAATVAELLNVPYETPGKSFAKEITE